MLQRGIQWLDEALTALELSISPKPRIMFFPRYAASGPEHQNWTVRLHGRGAIWRMWCNLANVVQLWRMWCKRLDMIRRGDAPGIPPPSVP